MIDSVGIQAVLPHRYPFLLVDRIIELERGKRAVGIKNVTVDEPFFQGHFPGNPVMPGVLILEAMAQVVAFAALGAEGARGRTPYLVAVDKAKFRRPVVPGDQLRLETELLRVRRESGRAACAAFVDGKLVADAEMTFALVDAAGSAAGGGVDAAGNVATGSEGGTREVAEASEETRE